MIGITRLALSNPVSAHSCYACLQEESRHRGLCRTWSFDTHKHTQTREGMGGGGVEAACMRPVGPQNRWLFLQIQRSENCEGHIASTFLTSHSRTGLPQDETNHRQLPSSSHSPWRPIVPNVSARHLRTLDPSTFYPDEKGDLAGGRRSKRETDSHSPPGGKRQVYTKACPDRGSRERVFVQAPNHHPAHPALQPLTAPLSFFSSPACPAAGLRTRAQPKSQHQ